MLSRLESDLRQEAERLRNLPPNREPTGVSAGDGPLRFQDLEIGPGDVPALMKLEGREFVRMAYVAVLRRQVDTDGEAVNLDYLETGMHKMEIILRLRLSPEGRKQRVRLRGLLLSLCDLLLCRIPLAGYSYRILKEVCLLPRTVQRLNLRIEKIREHINRSYE